MSAPLLVPTDRTPGADRLERLLLAERRVDAAEHAVARTESALELIAWTRRRDVSPVVAEVYEDGAAHLAACREATHEARAALAALEGAGDER